MDPGPLLYRYEFQRDALPNGVGAAAVTRWITLALCNVRTGNCHPLELKHTVGRVGFLLWLAKPQGTCEEVDSFAELSVK